MKPVAETSNNTQHTTSAHADDRNYPETDITNEKYYLKNGKALSILSKVEYAENYDKEGFLRDIESAWYNQPGNSLILTPKAALDYFEKVYSFYLTYSSYWEQAINQWQLPLFLYNNGLEASIGYYNERRDLYLAGIRKYQHPEMKFTETSREEYAEQQLKHDQLDGKIRELQKKSERMASAGRVTESNAIEHGGELRALKTKIYTVYARLELLKAEAMERAKENKK